MRNWENIGIVFSLMNTIWRNEALNPLNDDTAMLLLHIHTLICRANTNKCAFLHNYNGEVTNVCYIRIGAQRDIYASLFSMLLSFTKAFEYFYYKAGFAPSALRTLIFANVLILLIFHLFIITIPDTRYVGFNLHAPYTGPRLKVPCNSALIYVKNAIYIFRSKKLALKLYLSETRYFSYTQRRN